MTDLRQKLEERVRQARERLEQAEMELDWLAGRESWCQCDPRDWGCAPGPVCDNFEPDPDPKYKEYCRYCEHPSECHAAKNDAVREEAGR